jgi:hypothetical protein
MVRSERTIGDYDVLFNPIRAAREEKSGKQAGDPVRAAKALLKLIESNNPPVHILLGTDALHIVRTHLTQLLEQIDAWEPLSQSTDFADQQAQPGANL